MSRDLAIIDSQPAQRMPSAGDRLGGIVAAWLHEQTSARTKEAYGAMLAQFRAYIVERGHDLDAPAKDIAYMAQAFAGEAQRARWAGDPRAGRPVTPATHNLRLAALSSFYRYAINHDELPAPNPIERVKRHKREDYQGAEPLPFKDGEIQAALAAIPDDSPNDRRDRAMLYLALYTGRRLNEIASLTCKDITLTTSAMVVKFSHMKGDKGGKNILPTNSPASGALLHWLRSFYGRGVWPQDAYVFPSLSRNSYGRKMTAQGIEQRAARWLPIGKAGQKGGKFHALRHTFAASMLNAGATIHELSEALGHSDLAVTTKYVHKLSEGENTYLAALEDVYAGRPTRKRKER